MGNFGQRVAEPDFCFNTIIVHGRIMTPKDGIRNTNASLCDKRNCADRIKLKILRQGDCSGFSRGTQFNHKGP